MDGQTHHIQLLLNATRWDTIFLVVSLLAHVGLRCYDVICSGKMLLVGHKQENWCRLHIHSFRDLFQKWNEHSDSKTLLHMDEGSMWQKSYGLNLICNLIPLSHSLMTFINYWSIAIIIILSSASASNKTVTVFQCNSCMFYSLICKDADQFQWPLLLKHIDMWGRLPRAAKWDSHQNDHSLESTLTISKNCLTDFLPPSFAGSAVSTHQRVTQQIQARRFTRKRKLNLLRCHGDLYWKWWTSCILLTVQFNSSVHLQQQWYLIQWDYS